MLQIWTNQVLQLERRNRCQQLLFLLFLQYVLWSQFRSLFHLELWLCCRAHLTLHLRQVQGMSSVPWSEESTVSRCLQCRCSCLRESLWRTVKFQKNYLMYLFISLETKEREYHVQWSLPVCFMEQFQVLHRRPLLRSEVWRFRFWSNLAMKKIFPRRSLRWRAVLALSSRRVSRLSCMRWRPVNQSVSCFWQVSYRAWWSVHC